MQPAASNAVFRLLDPGLGASIQDRGRPGWGRFGVPASGWMDMHAALTAHRLLENDSGAPLLEILLQGARIEVLQPVWIALAGADLDCTVPTWRAYHAAAGEIIHVLACLSGVWSYLAVEGGLDVPRHFGSASYYARGKIGLPLLKGSLLTRVRSQSFHMTPGVSGRVTASSDRRDYSAPPPIRVWPGPQWDDFPHAMREKLLTTEWKVSAQSDRVGYRLEGLALQSMAPNIVSEPVRRGSVQVPENGQPIITMNDGPTVGGYPKIALVDTADFSWVAQTRPGQGLRFQLISS